MTEGRSKRSTYSDDDSASLSNLSSRLTRTTIREANNHLQMLYARNQELEKIIDEQQQALHRKDCEYQKLSKSYQLLEQHYQQVQALLDDRTRRLYVYERKEMLFRETLELKPAIESLVEVLNTFEQLDSTSTIALNSKPLQFIPPSNKTNHNDVKHQNDTI